MAGGSLHPSPPEGKGRESSRRAFTSAFCGSAVRYSLCPGSVAPSPLGLGRLNRGVAAFSPVPGANSDVTSCFIITCVILAPQRNGKIRKVWRRLGHTSARFRPLAALRGPELISLAPAHSGTTGNVSEAPWASPRRSPSDEAGPHGLPAFRQPSSLSRASCIDRPTCSCCVNTISPSSCQHNSGRIATFPPRPGKERVGPPGRRATTPSPRERHPGFEISHFPAGRVQWGGG